MPEYGSSLDGWMDMAQSKEATAQMQLVTAFKLRRLGAALLREADSLEAEAGQVIAAWDDPAIEREDIAEKPVLPESAINPKEEKELLDLIDGDDSAIADGADEDPPTTKQNKGNNPYPKTKDTLARRSLAQKVSRSA